MEEKDRDLLKQIAMLTEQNNKLLKRIDRRATWSLVYRVFYWSVVIGLSFGAYYFVQPYIDSLANTYGSIQTQVKNVQNVTGALKGILPGTK